VLSVMGTARTVPSCGCSRVHPAPLARPPQGKSRLWTNQRPGDSGFDWSDLPVSPGREDQVGASRSAPPRPSGRPARKPIAGLLATATTAGIHTRRTSATACDPSTATRRRSPPAGLTKLTQAAITWPSRRPHPPVPSPPHRNRLLLRHPDANGVSDPSASIRSPRLSTAAPWQQPSPHGHRAPPNNASSSRCLPHAHAGRIPPTRMCPMSRPAG